MLTVDRSYRDCAEVAPLRYKYPGQILDQPAYIELDEDGTVRVDFSGEIGNSLPSTVWNGRDLRWNVPNQMSKTGIDRLIDELLPKLEELYGEHTVESDGANLVGRLTERGERLNEEIEAYCYQIDTFEYGLEEVMAADELQEEE